MNLLRLIESIYVELLRFVPWFRGIWIGSIVLGGIMLMIAWMLKKNPLRKKSPWIVGISGLLLIISSSTQLIVSLF